MILRALFLTSFATAVLLADEPAIPAPVGPANYPALLERPPFREVIALKQSLVLSGVATLPTGDMVTVWDKASGQSFLVTSTPNPQGWILENLSHSTDLRNVEATIAAGPEKLRIRFDPERLSPPRLDNTSKPAARSEGDVMVEALLRSLDPAAAREFEGLAATGQESFRKSFSTFLSTYPTASDTRRLDFVQRTLEDVKESAEEVPEQSEKSSAPASIPAPIPGIP